jgi:hypothetical protein
MLIPHAYTTLIPKQLAKASRLSLNVMTKSWASAEQLKLISLRFPNEGIYTGLHHVYRLQNHKN